MLRRFWHVVVLTLLTAGATIASANAQDALSAATTASPQLKPRSADYISDSGLAAEDLTRKMLANNLELQAARQRLLQAEARLQQAELRPNPSLEFQEKNDRIISNHGSRERELTFKQPLGLFGKRSRRIEVAQVEIERIRYEVADLERQRRAELGTLLGQALAEATRLYALERITELNDSLRGATMVRVKAGDASRYESTQIEAEAVRLETDRWRVASRLDSLMLQLKALIGIDATEPFLLRAPALEPADEPIRLDEALRLALESRPDLKAARLAEEEAAAKIKLAETGSTSDVGVILGFKRPSTVDPAPVHSSDWQFKVGVSITLPVFNRNQGLIRESVAALNEARLHRESLEQFIRRDVMIAVKRLDQAQRDLKLYQDRALRLTRSSVQMAKLGFEQGELRLVDYIAEQRRLADLEDAYAQAGNELFQARVELKRALGQ